MNIERIDEKKEPEKYIKLLKDENLFLTIAVIGFFLACVGMMAVLCFMSFEYHSKASADVVFHGKNCKVGILNISSVDATFIGLTEKDKDSLMQNIYTSAPDICENVSVEITVLAGKLQR